MSVPWDIRRAIDECGLSLTEIADRAGIVPGDIRDLDFGHVPPTLMNRLADVLGASGNQFLGPGEPDNDKHEDDSTVVGAYLGEFPEGLTRDALAEALHWTLDRLERALAALDIGLRASGLRLRGNGRGVSLAGRLEHTDGLTRASIERLAEHGPILTMALARLTWDAMGSGIGEVRPDDRDVALVAEQQGLIYGHQGRLRLTWPVAFSLCLNTNHGWLWADGPWDQQPPTFRPC